MFIYTDMRMRLEGSEEEGDQGGVRGEVRVCTIKMHCMASERIIKNIIYMNVIYLCVYLKPCMVA